MQRKPAGTNGRGVPVLMSQTSIEDERCGTDANFRDDNEDYCLGRASWSPICAAAIASKSTTLGGGTWKLLTVARERASPTGLAPPPTCRMSVVN